LTSLLEPAPLLPPQSRAELAREERGTLVETAKDRWNEEVENAVRWVQRTDWDEVRERLEGAVSRLLNSQAAGKASDETAAAVEVAKDNAAQALASTQEGTSRIAEAAKLKAEEAAAIAHEKKMTAELKAADLRDATSRKVGRAGAEAKSNAHEVADSIRNSGGTIDAARGAVRDAISKGVEKSKEVIGECFTRPNNIYGFQSMYIDNDILRQRSSSHRCFRR
jgi:altered-inheritance-of-mitochondria protein 5